MLFRSRLEDLIWSIPGFVLGALAAFLPNLGLCFTIIACGGIIVLFSALVVNARQKLTRRNRANYIYSDRPNPSLLDLGKFLLYSTVVVLALHSGLSLSGILRIVQGLEYITLHSWVIGLFLFGTWMYAYRLLAVFGTVHE